MKSCPLKRITRSRGFCIAFVLSSFSSFWLPSRVILVVRKLKLNWMWVDIVVSVALRWLVQLNCIVSNGATTWESISCFEVVRDVRLFDREMECMSLLFYLRFSVSVSQPYLFISFLSLSPCRITSASILKHQQPSTIEICNEITRYTLAHSIRTSHTISTQTKTVSQSNNILYISSQKEKSHQHQFLKTKSSNDPL